MAATEDWKGSILSQLLKRNHKQSHPFVALIQTNNRLQEISSTLQSKNVHLQVEVEHLREEGHLSPGSAEAGGGGQIAHMLEQKLFKLQEELTELHKKRGENAQHIIDLNASLQEKEREILLADSRLADVQGNNMALMQAQKQLQQGMAELEATNQMLKDEHQALQIAFTALEEKYRKVQDDNRELIERWMELKSKDADRMNAENADFIHQRQIKLKQALADAAKEQIHIEHKPRLDSFTPAVCVSASVPSRAQHVFDAHEGEVYSILWNCSGSLFATGGADRKIKIWEYHNTGFCETKGTLVGSNAGITSLDFNQDDSVIVGGCNDFASRVWTVQDQRLRHTLTGHSGKVLSVKFLGDSRVVSGSHDRTLKVWDLHSRACVKTIFAGSSCNDLVTLHGTSIISGHFDRRVRFWDMRGADSSTNEILLQGRLTSLCLAPDKSQLLCCTRDDCLKIIDLRMNQVSHTLTADGYKVGCDWSRAVLSPDLEYAAAGSADGNVYVWNIAKGKVEKVLKEHSHAVYACSWNPSGASIVSCEKGRKIVYWSDY